MTTDTPQKSAADPGEPTQSLDELRRQLEQAYERIRQLEGIIRQQHEQLQRDQARLRRVTFQRDVIEQSRFGRARRVYLKWKNRLLRLLHKAEVDERYLDAEAHAMLPSPLEQINREKGWDGFANANPDQPDVVYFSIIEWGHLRQRPQHLMEQLADRGHRIFWIDVNLITEPDSPLDQPIESFAPGIYRVQLPGTVPLIYHQNLKGAVLERIITAFDRIRQRCVIENAICLINFPGWTPLALHLRDRFGWKVVYDCLDDQSAFRRLHRFATEDQEPALVRACDQVVVSSQALFQTFEKQFTPNGDDSRLMLIPNGVDFDRFSRAASRDYLNHLPRPIVGYYGSLAEWLDYRLIREAAQQRPQWSFVFIGQITSGAAEQWERLRSVPNIHYLPTLSNYQDLPAYLADFDVCTMPFEDTPLTRAANPVKLYEYLAAGKPIVVPHLPETEPFTHDNLLWTYGTLDQYLEQLDRAVAVPPTPAQIQARQAAAQENTWDKRAHVLEAAFHNLSERVTIIVVTFNNLIHTRLCLESILARTHWLTYQVVCVDNGSTPELVSYLQEMAARYGHIKVILNGRNLGFARANNLALRDYAHQSDYFVLLNDDTVVTTGWLPRLLRHARKKGVGLVGPVTNFSGNEARIAVNYSDLAGMNTWARAWMNAHEGETFEIKTLNAYCVLFSRQTLDRVGLLDERFYVGTFEDEDFSKRVREAGLRVVCARDVFIHHFGRTSFSKLDDAEYQQLFEAHRALYEAKWNERWQP